MLDKEDRGSRFSINQSTVDRSHIERRGSWYLITYFCPIMYKTVSLPFNVVEY